MNFQLRYGTISLLLILMLAMSACGASTETSVSSGENNAEASTTENDAVQNDAVQSGDAANRLNLNTVTGDELLSTIPDFGNRMVREFHEYRPYISIQQFRREIGKYVDDEQVAAYEQYIYVPIDINESDAETLKQLAGVDDAIAEALMAARPYESNAAFMEKLGESVSADEVAAGEAYLEVK